MRRTNPQQVQTTLGSSAQPAPCAAWCLRDEARGAKSKASRDGLTEFATKRIARKTTAPKGSVKNGRLTRQAGTPAIPLLPRTRIAGVLQSFPRANPIMQTIALMI
jgi:hypothetical protein